MAGEESDFLVIPLESTVKYLLESLVETRAEQAEDGYQRARKGYATLHHILESEPAEHHEGDGGAEEYKGEHGVEVYAKRAFCFPGHSLTGCLVGVAHALFERFFRFTLCFMGFEEEGTECRRESKGVQSRETDGDGHCDTELLVENT